MQLQVYRYVYLYMYNYTLCKPTQGECKLGMYITGKYMYLYKLLRKHLSLCRKMGKAGWKYQAF